MLESPTSASAISAALRMAWPAAPAFPPADRGKIRPTLKSPPLRPGTAGAGAAPKPADRSPEFTVPLQPARHTAAASAAAIATGHHPLATIPRKPGRVAKRTLAAARLYPKAMLPESPWRYRNTPPVPACPRPAADTKARRDG